LSSILALTERTIWSLSDSPAPRESKAIGGAGARWVSAALRLDSVMGGLLAERWLADCTGSVLVLARMARCRRDGMPLFPPTFSQYHNETKN
jgi:hypothetical protein